MHDYNESRNGLTIRVPLIQPAPKDDLEVFRHHHRLFQTFMTAVHAPESCLEFIGALTIAYEGDRGDVPWKRIFDRTLARTISSEVADDPVDKIVNRFKKQRERLFKWQETHVAIVAGRLTRPSGNFKQSWEYRLDFWPYFVSVVDSCPVDTSGNSIREVVREEAKRMSADRGRTFTDTVRSSSSRSDGDLKRGLGFLRKHFEDECRDRGKTWAVASLEVDLEDFLTELKDLTSMGEK